MTKTRARLATAFLAALMPFQSSAVSVRQFVSQSRSQQAEFVLTAVDKIVADVAKVNPVLSKAIRDYFKVTPPSKEEPPGVFAFAAELGAVENQADKGRLDLDKVQIEGILLDIIKADVMPQQISKNIPPSTSVQQ